MLVPASLEPDLEAAGLFAVGASVTAISPRGVEQYEAAAYQIAAQVMDSGDLRARVVPCEPTGTVDETCARAFVESFGPRAWRRPLEAAEVEALVGVAGAAAETLSDFWDGLEFALAALLQSPHFLFRVEIGEDDPDEPGGRRFADHEMATRLAFLLWDGPPDDELLAAADAGVLTTPAGIEAQVDRLLADPRAEEGVRNFFSEMLGLFALDALVKDPTVFTHASPEVGPSAREETLLGLLALVFDEDADVRDILTTRRTFLDRKLAAIYAVQAPARDGFGETELPEDGGRSGLLGHASVLALMAHPGSSSATLRGKFVRERLLCQEVPAPPADVNTAIPEPSEDAKTLRDRVAIHLQDPFCASCHEFMDPIGLALENFDGLGGWRTTENGAAIDPSGQLDGVPFADAEGLAAAVRERPELGACLTLMLYQYAQGRVAGGGEAEALDWLTGRFEDEGYRFRSLLRQLAISETFRVAGELE